jgi:nucleoside-diphosphate-sugar epimerase
MNQRIFLTGASGFVGGAIAGALRESAVVSAMSRSARTDPPIAALGAAPVRCELGSVSPDHLTGCDVVIHCAAFVKQWGTNEQFWQGNVTGTEQLLEVARQAGVRRFIHIGTEAALFNGQHLRNVDESYAYPNSTPFLYSATKAAAEQRVLAANAPGFETLSIRPRFVWGPGDQTVLPALVAMVQSGRFAWIDGGQSLTSTTHIANLVHGVRLALLHGRGGNAYFVLDDGVTTFKEFLTALLKTRGVDVSDKSMPSGVATFAATMMELAWRLFRLSSEPPLTRFAVSMMSHDCTLNDSKARRELNYAPVISRERALSELSTLSH